ncbi:MAG: hypothetical protein ACLSCQ_07855 [Evtepia gabavorous]
MQVEFGRLVTALGQAVSEAQRAVAAHAIGNYLAYFRRGPADQDGGAGYTPNTTSILFPPSTGGEEGARVAVPLRPWPTTTPWVWTASALSCVRRPRWTRRRNCCWISPRRGEPAENPRC